MRWKYFGYGMARSRDLVCWQILCVLSVIIAVFLLVSSIAAATPIPNGATIEERTFNDCPISVLTVVNDFPDSIRITDDLGNLCFGFANLHSWSFSDDGGITSVAFPNDSSFRFGADFKLDGVGLAEGGLRISPWYSKYVDGRCQVRVQDGEIACFGGRLPFYSFTADQGISYVRGDTIRLEAAYEARGLMESSPGVIRYRVISNGVRYDSPELAFDDGNPFDDPYGHWGILDDARAGGFFQQMIAPYSGMTATWSNIFFRTLPAAVDFAISPEILSTSSRGRWITGFIEPGTGYSAADVDLPSIRLNGTVPVAASFPARIGDFDNDGIPDLEVRFDRAAATASTSTRSSPGLMSVTGTVAGDPFYGEFEVTLVSK